MAKSLVAKLFIPFAWLATSIIFEIIMFTRTGWGWLPPGFFFSLSLMIIFALVVSCIRIRTIQIVIFSLALLVQAAIVLSNIGANSNLSEIFQFENLRAFREIWLAMESANIAFFLELILMIILFAIFLTLSIVAVRKTRNVRAGYNLKSLMVVILVITMTIGGKGINLALLSPVSAYWIENNNNQRFLFSNFSHRENYLRNFGSFAFYFRNLLHVSRINPTFPNNLPDTDFTKSDWQLCPGISINQDDWLLDENYNLIVLMMETVELDGIHPLLTPNLWRIKNMSTWVDGFYGHERTCMSEYIGLTGSHIHGNEMWSNYPRVALPHSLPNIFRRAGHEQIGAFHTFDRTFYNRHTFFTPDFLGFDFLVDQTSFDLPIKSNMNRNSDQVIIDAMTDYIAPADRTFFSYVLNISPHSSHFDSRQLFPLGTRDPITGSGISSSTITYDQDGRWLLQAATDFEDTLEWIIDNEHELVQYFPKLDVRDDYGYINNILRRAVIAYMVGLRDYDKAIGHLLERLETTPDFRDNTKMLIDTTAIALFSDHFNFAAYNHRHNPGGGLLSHNFEDQLLGERLSFMIYNPRDTILRDRDANIFNPLVYSYTEDSQGFKRLDLTNVGRRIERFMSNADVFPSIAHLFGVQTYNRFTLGVSVLDPSSISIGIGFVTNIYFGLCLTTNKPFQTRNLVTFYDRMEQRGGTWRRVIGEPPCDETVTQFRQRVNCVIGAMFKMRPIFRNNGFQHMPEAFYYIGSART